MKKDCSRYQFLSGSALKLIAVVSMLIDHIAAFGPLADEPVFLFSCFGRDFTLYYFMRFIGRAAFPISCFLLVQGFIHTRSRRAYAVNLLLFALLSELPWNLLHAGKLIYLRSQSVYVTLLLGYLGLCALERFKASPVRLLLSLGFLFYCSVFFHCDYGYAGYALILMLYLLRDRVIEKAVIGCGFLHCTYRAPIGFLPILLYNGKRGFIRGRFLKYVFYAFYPVHLLILYFLFR